MTKFCHTKVFNELFYSSSASSSSSAPITSGSGISSVASVEGSKSSEMSSGAFTERTVSSTSGN